MENKILETVIPVGDEIPTGFDKEYSIEIQDNYLMDTGEHRGRVGGFSTFVSKDKHTKYAKITLGTRKRFADKDIIQEVDRIFIADYHADSELVKILEMLGAIENHKFYPERLLNVPVKFTVKLNENATEDSRYKEMVTDIELVDNLSEDIDFQYVRVFEMDRFVYVPTVVGAKQESDNRQMTMKTSLQKQIEFEDDEDFLKFD